MTTIVRAKVAHTPRNPFAGDGALEAFEDGAVAFSDGRILACGEYDRVRDGHPTAEVLDARDTILLPGFVDAHVHYPQIRVIGAMGLELLDWLRLRSLPEEARLADAAYATEVADRFVRALVRNGTTTALVFGSHFPAAQDALFVAASGAGLRLCSGLVISDRGLRPELEVPVETAVEANRDLIGRWHGRGLIRYAVTPRFAVSCSEEMLSAAGELSRESDGVLVTTHLNENRAEIELVSELFPWAGAMACWAGRRCSRTTSMSVTMSYIAWPGPAPRWPIARRAMPSWAAGCSHCAGISSAESGLLSAPTWGPAPGRACSRRG
jgi:guanine deaminase